MPEIRSASAASVYGGHVISIPQGRLTLTTATPVLTANVAAAATVYYTPYAGNQVPIWNGTTFTNTTFSELSNVLANAATGNAGPAAGAAASNYDLFVWSNAGTLTLTRGAAWNSATARSATTENDLQRVNGIYCNLNAITNGPAVGYGTYVGTIRTDAATATVTFSPRTTAAAGGALSACNVWNMYNRVLVSAVSRDSTASWNYTSATVRSADNSNGNRIEFVMGLAEDMIRAHYVGGMTGAAVAGAFAEVGIGLDVTNAYSGWKARGTNMRAAADSHVPSGGWEARAIGYHFLQAVEAGDGTNATTFLGNSTAVQGLYADIWG